MTVRHLVPSEAAGFAWVFHLSRDPSKRGERKRRCRYKNPRAHVPDAVHS